MIGWYVHHHGRGHLQRAASVLAHLPPDRVGPVTVLTSAEVPDGVLPAHVDLLTLPRDDTGTGFPDPTAGGALHWAPLRHDGHRGRMARIARWLDDEEVRALVVDVSVEVTALGRLLGVPVVTAGMPGVRADHAHALGYSLSSAIVAPWPDWIPLAPGLAWHVDRLHPVGGISRFDGRGSTGLGSVGDRPSVVVLGGAGGSAAPAGYWAAVSAALPDVEVTALGGAEGVWVEDPWPLLRAADLVVTHAGQNAVADVAAAGVPAMVLPEPRPFGEQRATADVLRDADLAVVLDSLPSPDSWPRLIDAVRRSPLGDPVRSRERWARWQVAGAAARAADMIAEVAG